MPGINSFPSLVSIDPGISEELDIFNSNLIYLVSLNTAIILNCNNNIFMEFLALLFFFFSGNGSVGKVIYPVKNAKYKYCKNCFEIHNCYPPFSDIFSGYSAG
ncbi:hypothetical protein [Methanosarcina sp. WWM596]|uniref:hypothetical protein n=1 Tax=Methanosarcina sp. WWM596 TaxID=1434103 RepID=UPI00064E2EEF|nr:hypothetical protein [Methanosarcina sp. WWM596]